MLKRKLAILMTAALLAGNSSVSAFAAAGPAEAEPVIFEADMLAEERADEGDVRIAGTVDAPEPIETGKDMTIPVSAEHYLQYYTYKPEKNGTLKVTAQAIDTETAHIVICMYEGKINDNTLFFKSETNKVKRILGTVGLKAGSEYIIEVRADGLVPMDGDVNYTARFDFTEDEYWEGELDSVTSPKTILTNTEKLYQGTTGRYDNNDYYKFKLEKDCELSIYQKGADGTGGLNNGRVWLFKDALFSERVVDSYTNGDGAVIIKKELPAGDYYMTVYSYSHMDYEFKLVTSDPASSEKKDDEKGKSKGGAATGTAVMENTEYNSLKSAFSAIKGPMDYVIELKTDMIGEKNLSIPKKAASVTIKGNGHTILIKGTKLTSSCPLTLEDVTVKAQTAKGDAAKLTVNVKSDLYIGDNVKFDAKSVNMKCSGSIEVKGSLSANSLTAKYLGLTEGSVYTLRAGDKLTVKKAIEGKGGILRLEKGFKPIVLKGTVAGTVTLDGPVLVDGTQVLSGSTRMLDAETLKNGFDVSGVSDNGVKTYLCFYNKGKAGIFGEKVSYNGIAYPIWKDAVAKMDADVKAGTKNLIVKLVGNVNAGGALKMPKKGYESLTIEGEGHSLTFTGDVKLTGNTTVKGASFVKVNKKGEKVAGKVKKGKFTYSGPEVF